MRISGSQKQLQTFQTFAIRITDPFLPPCTAFDYTSSESQDCDEYFMDTRPCRELSNDIATVRAASR